MGALMLLVRRCIADMTSRGIDQWDEVYPSADTVLADIRARRLHVASLDAAPLVGVFTLDSDVAGFRVRFTISLRARGANAAAPLGAEP